MNNKKRGIMKGEEAEESCGRWRGGDGERGLPGTEGWISADGDRVTEKRKREGSWSLGREHGLLPLQASFPLVLLLRARGRKTPDSSAFPCFWFLCFWKRGPVTRPPRLQPGSSTRR